MKKRYYLFLPIYCSFFIGLGIYEVIHPSFSSGSARIGNYEIQITTIPSIPEVGKDTKIHFHFMDQYGNDVEKFRMSLKIYYNDELMRTFSPSEYNNGNSDIDYVFEKSGNHVLRVNILDLKSGIVTDYAFNVTTLALYGTIFSDLIIAGVAGAIGIIIAIIIFQKKMRPKNKL